MKAFPQHFGWQDGNFVAIAPPESPEILVADSWRVHQGNTWGLQDHVQRFMEGIEQQELDPAVSRDVTVEKFEKALQRKLSRISRVPPGLELFPRIGVETYRWSWRVVLLVRPSPPPRTTTSLRLPGYTDPRIKPTVKGPDIHLLRWLVQ